MDIYALVSETDLKDLPKADRPHDMLIILEKSENNEPYYDCSLDHGAIYLRQMINVWLFFNKNEHDIYRSLFELCKSQKFWDEPVDLTKNPELADQLNDDGTCSYRFITPDLGFLFVDSLNRLTKYIDDYSGALYESEITEAQAREVQAADLYMFSDMIDIEIRDGQTRYFLREIHRRIWALTTILEFAAKHGYSVIPD